MASDILDICTVHFDGDFDTQVRNVLDSVRLTRYEVESLRRLFFDLEQTLRMYWPGCVVMPFGSIVTGLGIKTSDADCYISLPEHLKTPGEMYVMTAKHVLRRRPAIFQQLFAITAAKVPIIKFFHAPTRCHCDVNFKSPSGVRNSKLIAYLLHMDERALPFAVLLKYWSKVHKLTGTNLLPNYAFTMMVIFFLQQMNVLPSVEELQRHVEPDLVDNWNTAFNENYQHRTNNNRSLYGLLGGFFEYYGTYHYVDDVISPYKGTSLNRNLFKRTETVPKEFTLYKDNIRRQKCKLLQLNSPMCVQDPFEHSRNGSMAVHQKLFSRFVCHLQHAADMFKHCHQDEFLRAILDPKNAPQMPGVSVLPQTQNRDIPNRLNKVTKAKNRNKGKKNMNLHTLYTEANRVRRQHLRQ